MKNTITLKAAVLGIALLTTFSVFAQKKKAKDERMKTLEGKKYAVQFYEIKSSGRGKALPDNVVLKNGEIQCNLMEDKITLPPTPFQIVSDSTYTEDEMEVKTYNIQAQFTEDKDSYKWEAVITNYDIEGTVTQSKNGVEKKKFEFAGSEKAKKK